MSVSHDRRATRQKYNSVHNFNVIDSIWWKVFKLSLFYIQTFPPLCVFTKVKAQSMPLNSKVLGLIRTYHCSDKPHQSWPVTGCRRTVASCMVYLFKGIPIKEPFGLNTFDKDQRGWGSSPAELFTRGQRTSALSSLKLAPISTLRRARVLVCKGIYSEKFRRFTFHGSLIKQNVGGHLNSDHYLLSRAISYKTE